MLDVDDTIIKVHGHAKQGAGFGYSGVRGLNALLATLTTATSAPVIVAQRLRKGSTGSPRGAKRLVGDAVKLTRRLLGPGRPVLVRADAAFYGRGAIHAALAGGAQVSVTVRMDKAVKAAIAAIPDDAWTTIEYTDAVFDEASGKWISRAEVAEVPFTAFAAQKKSDHVRGRLVVRRIPDLNAEKKKAAGQGTLFDTWRFHAFFTTVDPEVSTRSPRTRPTDTTRSSSRSTPTSRARPSPTYPRGRSQRTPHGWCWRSSRSTLLARPPARPNLTWRRRPPPRSAAS